MNEILFGGIEVISGKCADFLRGMAEIIVLLCFTSVSDVQTDGALT